VKGKESGTYVGPTVIDFVTPQMSVAKEEIFGPVISIMRTKRLMKHLRSKMQILMEMRRVFSHKMVVLHVILLIMQVQE
jgi:delta 1-pyrroline-5-carboxylate dehydrogenase